MLEHYWRTTTSPRRSGRRARISTCRLRMHGRAVLAAPGRGEGTRHDARRALRRSEARRGGHQAGLRARPHHRARRPRGRGDQVHDAAHDALRTSWTKASTSSRARSPRSSAGAASRSRRRRHPLRSPSCRRCCKRHSVKVAALRPESPTAPRNEADLPLIPGRRADRRSATRPTCAFFTPSPCWCQFHIAIKKAVGARRKRDPNADLQARGQRHSLEGRRAARPPVRAALRPVARLRQRRPEAVVTDDAVFTFRELDDRANQTARFLIEQGLKSGRPHRAHVRQDRRQLRRAAGGAEDQRRLRPARRRFSRPSASASS